MRIHIGWLAAIGGLLAATACVADQIVTSQRSYTGAKIVGFDEGNIHFRTGDGVLHREWVGDVKLLFVDRGSAFDDLNQAERFLRQGQRERSLVRYRRALRVAADFWEDLITARVLIAADDGTHVDSAARYFILLTRGTWGGQAAAARLLPHNIPSRKTKRTARAIEHLNNALFQGPPAAQRVLLDLLRYKILRATDDPGAAVSAPRVAALVIPPEVRFGELYRVKLLAIRQAVRAKITPELLTGLDEVIRFAPDTLVPEALMVKGEMLLRDAASREAIGRAAWPFLRVAIHFPDDPLAPEGLYEASSALEKLSRPDQALRLLDECLSHAKITKELRAKAEAAKKRLETQEESSPG